MGGRPPSPPTRRAERLTVALKLNFAAAELALATAEPTAAAPAREPAPAAEPSAENSTPRAVVVARVGVEVPEDGSEIHEFAGERLADVWVEGVVDAPHADIVALVARPFASVDGWLDVLVSVLDANPHVVAVTPQVVGGEPMTDMLPVSSPVVVVRASALHALGTLWAAPDELAVASLVHQLAAVGPIEPAADCVVQERGSFTRGTVPAGTVPMLTIVVPTLDAASDRVRACIRSIQTHTTVPYEIVLVDNGAPAQGFSAPVNSGIRAARGRYVVVCNDDVRVLPGWWEPLRASLDSGAVVAFPNTVAGAMRADFAAWCFALTAESVTAMSVEPGEFLDPALRVWYQDTDLLQRLRLAGTPPVLVRDSSIVHGLSKSVLSPDPALKAWVVETVQQDRAVFQRRWGSDVPGAA